MLVAIRGARKGVDPTYRCAAMEDAAGRYCILDVDGSGRVQRRLTLPMTAKRQVEKMCNQSTVPVYVDRRATPGLVPALELERGDVVDANDVLLSIRANKSEEEKRTLRTLYTRTTARMNESAPTFRGAATAMGNPSFAQRTENAGFVQKHYGLKENGLHSDVCDIDPKTPEWRMHRQHANHCLDRLGARLTAHADIDSAEKAFVADMAEGGLEVVEKPVRRIGYEPSEPLFRGEFVQPHDTFSLNADFRSKTTGERAVLRRFAEVSREQTLSRHADLTFRGTDADSTATSRLAPKVLKLPLTFPSDLGTLRGGIDPADDDVAQRTNANAMLILFNQTEVPDTASLTYSTPASLSGAFWKGPTSAEDMSARANALRNNTSTTSVVDDLARQMVLLLNGSKEDYVTTPIIVTNVGLQVALAGLAPFYYLAAHNQEFDEFVKDQTMRETKYANVTRLVTAIDQYLTNTILRRKAGDEPESEVIQVNVGSMFESKMQDDTGWKGTPSSWVMYHGARKASKDDTQARATDPDVTAPDAAFIFGNNFSDTFISWGDGKARAFAFDLNAPATPTQKERTMLNGAKQAFERAVLKSDDASSDDDDEKHRRALAGWVATRLDPDLWKSVSLWPMSPYDSGHLNVVESRLRSGSSPFDYRSVERRLRAILETSTGNA